MHANPANSQHVFRSTSHSARCTSLFEPRTDRQTTVWRGVFLEMFLKNPPAFWKQHCSVHKIPPLLLNMMNSLNIPLLLFMSMSLNCSHQRLYCSSSRRHKSMQSHGGMTLTGEPEELGEKPVPVPLCSPQIKHGLTWA
jgi:hypothetical protein